jgi:sigma-B regulation protein RsbU (phosphoserine phosphatase)
MRFIPLELESTLRQKGVWPESRLAWASLYMIALDLLLFAVQLLTRSVLPRVSASLEGWVTSLSILAVILFMIAGARRLRVKLLWRLRNRLIVTYVFIGVIPVFLLVVISIIALYLFAGQFASFVITSDIATHLRSMEASNHIIAHSLANQSLSGLRLDSGVVGLARPRRPEWSRRQVCVWYRDEVQPNCSGPEGAIPFDSPAFITADFRDIVRDHERLYLRVATAPVAAPEALRVITSEPLDKNLVQEIAGDLGQVVVSPNANASQSFLSIRSEQTIAAGNKAGSN